MVGRKGFIQKHLGFDWLTGIENSDLSAMGRGRLKMGERD
jgi:hypothetical protein